MMNLSCCCRCCCCRRCCYWLVVAGRRVVLEPAGALAIAGIKKYVSENNITGQTMVAISSGANMDFDRLRFVSERADESEQTLSVTIPERPGAFRDLYSLIWPRNVTEFSYRYETESAANILISFQPVMNIENDFNHVVDKLRENNFPCLDLSNNELAKVHVRHLAGGRSSVENERLFRFDFPEVSFRKTWFSCCTSLLTRSFFVVVVTRCVAKVLVGLGKRLERFVVSLPQSWG